VCRLQGESLVEILVREDAILHFGMGLQGVISLYLSAFRPVKLK
jgi:hypothetical protein